eukprot:3763472-Pyramimonas_sp.AAC.1
MVSGLHACLRRDFPTGKPARHDLQQGGFVVCIVSRAPEPLAQEEAEDHVTQTWWMNISFQSLSPLFAVYAGMGSDSSIEDDFVMLEAEPAICCDFD